MRPKILDILMHSTDAAADSALIAGLPLVDEDQQCQVIDVLLNRGKDKRLETLPESYHELGPRAQARLIANTAHLFGALRMTIRSPNLQSRLNSLSIIRRSQNPRLAHLAAAAVRDGAGQVRAEASSTLRELAERHCKNHDDTAAMLREALDGDAALHLPIVQTLRLLRDERQQVIGAIRESLTNYESHHRPEVLESAMYLAAELEDSLFQDVALKRGKLTQAMLEIYSNQPSPRFAAFTYVAMRHADLRRRIVAILSNLRDSEFFAEFISYSWLARDPEIHHNMLFIRAINWLGDGYDAAFALPPHVAALAPAWIATLGLSVDQKIKLLTNFLLIDNPEANRAAVWALARMNNPAATMALQGFVDHDDLDVRRIAEYECRHRHRINRLAVAAGPRNRPQQWCELLERSGLTENFEDFWLHFDRLSPDLARSAGHFAMRFISGFQMQVQLKLSAAQIPDRIRALKLLFDLNLAERFSRDIFTMANDPVAEIRAASMRTLAALPEATSRRILERGLSDSAPEVQAAAIESLDLMAVPKRLQLFLPKTQSEFATVRAAAVQALLKMQVSKAAYALVSMLKDPRPEHRCSALLVIENLRLTAITQRVAEMAQSDPDPKILRIAQQVLRRLEKTQRPSGRAAGKLRPPVRPEPRLEKQSEPVAAAGPDDFEPTTPTHPEATP